MSERKKGWNFEKLKFYSVQQDHGKDEYQPEYRQWAGICPVDKIKLKLNRVLADYFVNSFHWIKG